MEFGLKSEVFQFHVRLVKTAPVIWRRLQVYSHITFDEFHSILQSVMGWSKVHQYEFRFKKYSIIMPRAENSFQWDKSIQIYAHEINLYEMLKRAGQKFQYIYDFDDKWGHEILFEKRHAETPDMTYPLCVGGEMACPPEGVGGIDRFYELLQEGNDPRLADFNPKSFSMEEVNERLRKLSERAGNLADDWQFEEMLNGYLEYTETPFSLDDCFKELNVKKTPENEKDLDYLLLTSGEVVKDKDLFYPRVSFLKDFAIRITPTDFEIDHNILIPGHRLIPFLPLVILTDESQLMYNNTALKELEINLSVHDLDTYFGLVDSQELPILNSSSEPYEENRVTILAFDMTRFYKKNQFEPGDSIILTMDDYQRAVFSIRYDPMSNLKVYGEQIKYWDNLFIACLKKVLQENIENSYLGLQMMYTYYCMSKALTPEQKKIPGTEVPQILKRSREISWSETEDTGMILHTGGKVVVNISHKDS
ncbi:MAG: plasmid pRiA4b ORF-3 family protein [Candidatus Omnitrophota bacterium]